MIELEVLAFQERSTVCCLVPPEPLAVLRAELELLIKRKCC